MVVKGLQNDIIREMPGVQEASKKARREESIRPEESITLVWIYDDERERESHSQGGGWTLGGEQEAKRKAK